MRTATALLFTVGLILLGAFAPGSAPVDEGDLLLVANKNGNSLYIVDAETHAVRDTVPTGESPHEVAAASKARRAYVANYGEGTISVVDIDAGRAVERWPVDGYERLHGIQVGPNEERIYVTAEAQQSVLELDAATGNVLRTFRTGKQTTHMLALAPNGERLFATSIGSGTATLVDLETGRVIEHVATGEGAEGVAVGQGEVWVTNRGDDTVAILNSESGTTLQTLEVDGFPIRVAFYSRGQHAIVSAPRAGQVAIFDAADRELLKRIETGSKPIGVVSGTQSRMYVANMGSNTVTVIDLESLAVSDTIEAGAGPDGMAYVPAE